MKPKYVLQALKLKMNKGNMTNYTRTAYAEAIENLELYTNMHQTVYTKSAYGRMMGWANHGQKLLEI